MITHFSKAVALCLVLSSALNALPAERNGCTDQFSTCAWLAQSGYCTPNHAIGTPPNTYPMLTHCAWSCNTNNCQNGGWATAAPVTASPAGSGSFNPAGCGMRPLVQNREASNETVDARVVNGQIAYNGDWGWSVSFTSYNQHFCGGILINNQYILSAAHCFQQLTQSKVDSFVVDIGVHNKQYKEARVQSRKVAYVIAHEQYNGQTMANDIAIIKLASPVNLDNQYAIAACVPGVNGQQFDYDPVSDFDKKQGWVTGWGDQYYQSQAGSVEKRQGVQDILTKKKCTEKYANFRFNSVGQICAGETTQYSGACQGDSGGPFVVKHTDGRWYAYGIVSFGLDCGYGTVYTRVSNYISWIQKNMY